MLRMKEVMKAGKKQDSKEKTARYSEIEKEMDLVTFMENVVIMGYFQRMDNYELEHLN